MEERVLNGGQKVKFVFALTGKTRRSQPMKWSAAHELNEVEERRANLWWAREIYENGNTKKRKKKKCAACPGAGNFFWPHVRLR